MLIIIPRASYAPELWTSRVGPNADLISENVNSLTMQVRQFSEMLRESPLRSGAILANGRGGRKTTLWTEQK